MSGILASVVVLIAAACIGNESPTDPAASGAIVLDLRPSFAVSAADASALPINRIRYGVVLIPDGLHLARGFVDVDPAASSWELGIEITPPTSPARVLVRTQLVHVDGDGTEQTEFSGVTDTLVVDWGGSPDPAPIDLVRGPLANLHVTGVQVTSQLSTLVEGETRALVADLESDGTVDTEDLVTYWTSLDTAVARLDGSTVMALSAGGTDIVATVGALSDTVPVSIRGPVASVEILPDSTDLVEGESVGLVAVLESADGTLLTGLETFWSSEDTTIATVDSTGIVTGVAPGITTITATSEGVSGTARVHVVLYALTTAFVTAGNTELVAGSYASPSTPHAYSSANLLTGTSDVVVTTVGSISTQLGGEVEMEPDGDFRYRPPADLTVGDQDAFDVVSSGDIRSTITVDVVGDVVWYVDNTAAPGGTGRSHDPFATLAEAGAAADPGEIVYLSRGDGTVTGQDAGVVLLDGQELVGSGVALTVPGVGTLAPAGTSPAVTNTSGAAVTLANGNRLAGFRIEDPVGAAIEAVGVADGQLDSLAIVASGGAAFRLEDATGVWQSSHLDITASSPAGGLVVRRGDPVLTLDVAAGAFDNLPGGGPAIQVDTTAGGSVTVQGGDIRERGSGISIRGAGGDVRIASFLDVDTTSGPGLEIQDSPGAMRFDSIDIATVASAALYTSGNPGTIDLVGRVEARGDYGWNAQCLSSTPAPCGEINARFSAFLVVNDGSGARSRAWFMARAPAFVEIDTLDVEVGAGWQTGAAIQFLDMSYGGSLTITSPESRVVAPPTLAGLDLLAGTTFGNPAGINFTVDMALALLTGGAGRGYSGSPHCLCGVDGSFTVSDVTGLMSVRNGTLDLTLDGAPAVAADSLAASSITLAGAVAGAELTNSASTSMMVEGTLDGTLVVTGNAGSTVEAPSPANTASSTSGPAVQIEDTEIGTAGVTFESVSATSDPAAPSPGIVLRGTGTSGGLTVSGTGTAGSGGTIDVSPAPTGGDPPEPAILVDGSTTAGAFVGALADLSWLDVAASADTAGIRIDDADVTLRNISVSGARTGLDVTAEQPASLGVFDATFSGSGSGTTPASVHALGGAVVDATFERSTFENGSVALRLQATSSTLDISLTENLYASNASYGLYAASVGDPSGSLTVTSTDEVFDDNLRGPRSVMGPGADTGGFVDVTLVRPTITGPSGLQTVGASVWSYRPDAARLRIVGPAEISGYGRGVWGKGVPGSGGQIELELTDVTIMSSDTAGVVVEPVESVVTLRNNTIDGVTCGNGIRLHAAEGSHRYTVENNTVRNVDCDHGISVASSGPTVAGPPPTEYAVTMVGNDVLMPATAGLLGIELAGRAGRNVGCFDVRGNTAAGGTGSAGIGLNDDAPPAGRPVFLLERLLGGSGTTSDPAVVEAHVENENPGTTTSDATAASVTGVPGGSCAAYFDTPNAIPIAEPGGPYVAEVGTSVLFDGSASIDPAPGTITSYEWLVDGVSVSLSSSPTFQHPCTTEARFGVDLVVTDDRGDTSTRSTLLDCQVTRFLGRWLDEAGNPITSTSVGDVVELQLCFLEDDLTAFQADVDPPRWSFMAQVDSVADFDNTVAGTHPDCAGTADIVDQVSASAILFNPFTVTALTTATGPGSGPQGVLSLFFTFTATGVFDQLTHRDVFSAVVLETFDGNPPPFVIDLPDLPVN